MATRKPPSLENLEAATSEDRPLAIPPDARVRIDFQTKVDPSPLINESRYNDELAQLAASEQDDEPIPIEPLAQFAAENAHNAGCTMRVTRLADPAARRIPGQTYNRQCLDVESLGEIPFDPANLHTTLQLINGNSGGAFRLWIVDENGDAIAYLQRVVIGDPPKSFSGFNPQQPPPYYQQQPQQPAKHEPSDLERRMQALQERLLENALARLLEPPPAPQPVAPTVSDEDRLYLMLAREGNMLSGVVNKLTNLAGASEAATAKQTWSDWLKETGGELLRANPEIGERITNTLANVVTLVLDRLPGKQQQPQQPQLVPYSGGRIEPLTPRAAVNDEDEDETIDQTANDTDLENDTMIVLEDLVGLLSGNEPLRPDHPVFIRLKQEYPVVFTQAISLIAQYPLDSIILWVKSKGELYANLLSGDATGPHLRRRLQELKDLANAPAPAPPTTQPEITPNAEPQQTQPTRRRRQAPPTS